MSKPRNWTATTSSGKIVHADPNRKSLFVQSYDDGPVNIGIGKTAETDKGPRLGKLGSIQLTGAEAGNAIYAITGSGTASGTWE